MNQHTDLNNLITDKPAEISTTNTSQNSSAGTPGQYVNTAQNENVYTEEEIRDVNKITVTIPDNSTPIVILFGSASSGKTLALLRMIRFLEKNGYTVVPEEVFRPASDTHHARMCKGLKDLVYSEYTPGGNDEISFMLVKVLDRAGNPVCQILEAPGEHYFNGSANLSFPAYINRIRVSTNRKKWVFLVETDWGENQTERDLYAQKITQMQGLISPADEVVFLCNKVDLKRHMFLPNNKPNTKAFFNTIRTQYPGIFERYRRSGLARFMFGEYTFKFVCFTSGVFNFTSDGLEVWNMENDSYCVNLWNAIR